MTSNNQNNIDDSWDLTIRIFANELGIDDEDPFYEELLSLCNELLFTLPDERWKVRNIYYFFLLSLLLLLLLIIIIFTTINTNDYYFIIS